MIDIKYIREHTKEVRDNLAKRKNPEILEMFDELIEKDKKEREMKIELDKMRKRRNDISKEINEKKKTGEPIEEFLKEVKELPDKIKQEEEQYEKLTERITELRMRIPNILHESVPYGESEEDNVIIKTWGTPRKKEEWMLPHADLVTMFDLVDTDKASEISASRFYYLKGDFVLLEQALLRYGLDKMVKKGFIPLNPPYMIRKEIIQGATDAYKFGEDIYKIEGEDLYLIATAEHGIIGYHKNDILPEKDLPLKYVGLTPCFRKEAGSHGKDTKGIFRTHQFHKVEMIIFSKPEDSWKFHEELIKINQEIMEELELPYRIINTCTGELGVVHSKLYDVEAWFPVQEQYREVMSCTNALSYQAVRSNIRYEKKEGDKEYVHILNDTVIAAGRTMTAIIENNQQKEGNIKIPNVLVPYMNGKTEIKA
ncbi:serine--tRNA ligase [Candidatus Micrarchaeota archaeon]|nr:serine--tRNA ligase [Candidatus Micrarchaeota archaeon]